MKLPGWDVNLVRELQDIVMYLEMSLNFNSAPGKKYNEMARLSLIMANQRISICQVLTSSGLVL